MKRFEKLWGERRSPILPSMADTESSLLRLIGLTYNFVRGRAWTEFGRNAPD
jgi:hypothetical protein